MPEISEEELKKLQDASKERDTLKSEKEKIDKERSDKEKADKEKADKEKAEKDGDLNDKVSRERKAAEDKKEETKKLEVALKFNMGLESFVKENSEILPSDIPEIVKAAEKEKYDTAIEKASAIRSAVMKSFFSVQAHVDLLTAAQKQTLEDWNKLTKNGREERSAFIYENLFEPALEMHKKIKKAEELGKSQSGFVSGNKVQDDYKQRLINLHKKGEK
jgi:hypothetical protein